MTVITASLAIVLLVVCPADAGTSGVDALLAESTRMLERGETDSARAGAQRALELARKLADRRAEGWALLLTGDTRFGEPAVALSFYRQALEVLREVHDDVGEANALKDIGITQRDLGDYEGALDTLDAALQRFRRLGIMVSVGSTLESIGAVYAGLGILRRAEEAYEETLRIAEREGDPELQAVILIRTGLLSRDDRHALKLFEKAREAAERSGKPQTQAWALVCVGETLARLGRTDEALPVHHQVVDRYRRLGDPGGEAMALRDLATLQLERDPSLAVATLERALTLAEGSAPKLRWGILSGLGVARLKAGDLDGAIDALETASESIRAVRGRLEKEDNRSAFTGQFQRLTDRLMEAYLERGASGDLLRAFRTVERERARETLAAIAAARAPEPETPPAWPEDLDGIRPLLGKRTALVSYAVTSDGVHAFVLTQGGLETRRLPVSSGTLTPRVESAVELLTRDDVPAARPILARLRDELLSPVLSILPDGVDRLVIVPDRVLQILPFEALPGRRPGLPFVQDFVITYAPSASVWAKLEGSRRTGSDAEADLLLLANPVSTEVPPGTPAARALALHGQAGFRLDPLPYSAMEAREVSRTAAHGSEVLVGAEARESRLKRGGLERFRILHFAAHAVLDERNPSRSALFLNAAPGEKEDGFLSVEEIYRLRLRSDLVVLSGCRTARGELLMGEGTISLARAFFHAGTRAVVASLWEVRDDTTLLFMRAFYGHLASGTSPAEALRQTKLERIGSSPNSWAPFVLIGSGSQAIPLSGAPPDRALLLGALLALALAVPVALLVRRSFTRGASGL